jgi:hypothetical protein
MATTEAEKAGLLSLGMGMGTLGATAGTGLGLIVLGILALANVSPELLNGSG